MNFLDYIAKEEALRNTRHLRKSEEMKCRITKTELSIGYLEDYVLPFKNPFRLSGK